MRSYTVYFEIYGKKMRATVQAQDRVEAREIIKSKLIIHKVTVEPDKGADFIDFFNNMIKK